MIYLYLCGTFLYPFETLDGVEGNVDQHAVLVALNLEALEEYVGLNNRSVGSHFSIEIISNVIFKLRVFSFSKELFFIRFCFNNGLIIIPFLAMKVVFSLRMTGKPFKYLK